jgi:hypothetical protein
MTNWDRFVWRLTLARRGRPELLTIPTSGSSSPPPGTMRASLVTTSGQSASRSGCSGRNELKNSGQVESCSSIRANSGDDRFDTSSRYYLQIILFLDLQAWPGGVNVVAAHGSPERARWKCKKARTAQSRATPLHRSSTNRTRSGPKNSETARAVLRRERELYIS